MLRRTDNRVGDDDELKIVSLLDRKATHNIVRKIRKIHKFKLLLDFMKFCVMKSRVTIEYSSAIILQ
jgi:hypothetical protein